MNTAMLGDYATHCDWMRQAIAIAAQAGAVGDVPVGAIVVGPDGTAIATGENRRERDADPTAHAEILALRQAGQRLGDWRLEHCTLYVTLEPCPMCASAIQQARIKRLVYGADDPKIGAVRTVMNLYDQTEAMHSAIVLGGILAEACQHQLQQWFVARRNLS